MFAIVFILCYTGVVLTYDGPCVISNSEAECSARNLTSIDGDVGIVTLVSVILYIEICIQMQH
jgi:hypothetical protein